MRARPTPVPDPLCQTVEIRVEDARWDAALPRFQTLAETAVAAALAASGDWPAGEAAEISVLATDDARIAGLNGTFRGKARATNVLAWPSGEPADANGHRFLGDIALAFDTMTAEADAAGTAFSAHTAHLLVHATLHLLGFDHQTDEDAAGMEEVEVRALASLGVRNPYL